MDLPLHPLLIHLTVVLVPVAAITGAVFALVPGWRWLLRWPAALFALLAAVIVQLSLVTGEDLAATFPQMSAPLHRHEQLGEQLSYVTYPFAALTVLAAWVLPSTSPLTSGRGARTARWGAVGLVLRILVPLAAIAVIVFTVLTGHAGATAVWG